MPEVIACTACGRKLRVADELVGRRAKCPACGHSFLAEPTGTPASPPLEDDEEEAAPPRSSRHEAEGIEERPSARKARAVPPPLDDDEEEPEREERRRPRRRKRPVFVEEWDQVRRGLGLILAAIFTGIGNVVFVFIAFLLIILLSAGAAFTQKDPMAAFQAAFGTGGMLALVVMIFAGVVGLTALVIEIIGLANCCAAPEKNHANTLARATLWLLIAALVMPFVTCLVGMVVGLGGMAVMSGDSPAGGVMAMGAGAIVLMVFNLLNVLLAGGSYFTFLFFLRAVAASVRSPGLALSVLILIIVSGVAVLMNLGSWVLSFFVNAGQNLMDSQGMTAGGAGLVGVCGCCGDFIWIANAVWLIVTLFLVRAAITRYVEGRA